MPRRVGAVVMAVLGALGATVAPALGSGTPTAPLVNCVGAAGDPTPGSTAWRQRDAANQLCATGRIQDEYTNPATGATFQLETPSIFAQQTLVMLSRPGHFHASLGQLVPGGTTADPFRSIDRWKGAGRGRVTPISFDSSDGAELNGYLFEPSSGQGPFPGVIITTGSIQGYQQLYFWAAEGLAEAGYVVMTYDVQGQGNSDTLPASCSVSSCQGVPFQQNYNFFQGAEDALNWFLSTPTAPYRTARSSSAHNPLWASIDPAQVGVAGHSLGAVAVSELGQCDTRVRAIVAWDDLAKAEGPCPSQITIPAQFGRLQPSLLTPALGINSEYFFTPESMSSGPDPHARDDGYRQLVSAGDDAMQIALRQSTHLEYSYVPYLLPASELGERVAFYYTLAWFDRYLRGDESGFARLVSARFDTSSDVHSIGAGTYSAARAEAHPTDPTAGNVAYMIGGLPVVNRLSFYYMSEYTLHTPSGQSSTCLDLRAGCPPVAPATP